MAIDDFGNCVSNGVQTTYDNIASVIRAVAVDKWHQFITWFHGLSPEDRALFLVLLTFGLGVLTKFLGAIFGSSVALEIAAAIFLLIGLAEFGIVIEAMINCEPQLDV